MKKLTLNSFEFTDAGRQHASIIMQTLGKKTKLQFLDELKKEFDTTVSTKHQMLTAADVIRVCDTLKIDHVSALKNNVVVDSED